MKTTLPAPTEHQIQNAVIGYLKARGYYVQRLNAGKFSMGEGRNKRFIQGVEVGTPDVMAFKPLDIRPHLDVKPVAGIAVLYFIEVKRPGKVPTVHQEAKMAELEEYGAKCLVVHSVEELEQLI